MKTVILSLATLLFSVSTYSQTTQQETQKIATFCKLWGFLKYYHPTVAKGKLNWDQEFMTRINIVASLKSKQEINGYYAEWIRSLGTIKNCRKCENNIPDTLKFNLDTAWRSDSNIFTTSLIHQLRFIEQNRSRKRNYYVQQNKWVRNTKYENESKYVDSVFPSKKLRLLGLSRYWNIVNYFYPYKYKIDQDWNDVLIEMIPKFKDAGDTISYHLAMLELTAKIDDSHARFATKYTQEYFGWKWVPFGYKVIDNKVIVTEFYNDSLCQINDIRMGDVFLKVGNLAIEDIVKERSRYIAASNEPTRLRNFYRAVFNGNTDSVSVSFERDGIVSNKVVYRYFFKDFRYGEKQGPETAAYKIVDGNIGYVDLGRLEKKNADECLNKLRDTKAIIFDVRNYPKGTMYHIANFLNADNKPFAKFTTPDISYPGVFRYSEPYSCGKDNENPYAGKVILLFNETSQSHAEFTLMALQTAPNVVSIGSQTAGADGNVSEITLPGNYKTYMTGIGVYYPDGRETQRIGIVPDIEVKPTIEGLKLGKDEVLEKALEIVNTI